MGGLKESTDPLDWFYLPSVAISLPEMGGLKESIDDFEERLAVGRNQSPRDGRAES